MTAVERSFLDLVARIVDRDVEVLDVRAGFFDNGGDSLNVVEFLPALLEHYGLRLDLDDIFEMTIAELWSKRMGTTNLPPPESLHDDSVPAPLGNQRAAHNGFASSQNLIPLAATETAEVPVTSHEKVHVRELFRPKSSCSPKIFALGSWDMGAFLQPLWDELDAFHVFGLISTSPLASSSSTSLVEKFASLCAALMKDLMSEGKTSSTEAPICIFGLGEAGVMAFNVGSKLVASGLQVTVLMLGTQAPPGQPQLGDEHAGHGAPAPRIVVLKTSNFDDQCDPFYGWRAHQPEFLSLPVFIPLQEDAAEALDSHIAALIAAGVRHMLLEVQSDIFPVARTEDHLYVEHAILQSAFNGDFLMCCALLRECSTDIPQPQAIRDAAGRTLLHHAAANDDIALMKLMFARGADLKARDINEKTPLQVAYEAWNMQAVSLLGRWIREGCQAHASQVEDDEDNINLVAMAADIVNPSKKYMKLLGTPKQVYKDA